MTRPFSPRHSFSNTDDNKEIQKLTHHNKPCRALEFSSDGQLLYTASRDKSICCVDVETGKKKRIAKAHEYVFITFNIKICCYLLIYYFYE